MLKEYFFNTNHQKILNFLCNHPNESFYDKEISRYTRLSRGGTNTSLHKLAKAGLVIKQKKGKMNFYSIDLKNPLIRQIKIINNILSIYNLVKKLCKYSEKIILFGSNSEGKNLPESDVDIFVLTNQPDKIKDITKKVKQKIQFIIKTPLEFVNLESKDTLFYNEIMRGIILWEKE